MDQATNCVNLDISASEKTNASGLNGNYANGFHEPSREELERELPLVYDGQVPLGDVLSRVVQSIFAELSELAETMPNMSDSARKRTLADWVVKTKKQIVKLYAVAKWARDADTVQKCMNITAFLMNQNQQFEEAINALTVAKENLDPARLRNHDLLTSLDVLTTGSYRRLPSEIKKLIIPPIPLSDAEVLKTLKDMEDVIRYRLRMTEIIPVEMSKQRIADGRAYFTVPKLFETSLCLRGAERDAGWFFVHVKFLLTVGGDLTGIQEFPCEPSGTLKRHLADEADARLAFYLPIPPDQLPTPSINMPPRPQLPEGMADAPLVRVFNFLQMMSLSYQLEILWYQAQRMRSLGWADYLQIEMTNNRKTLKASYWIRQPPPTILGRASNRSKLPISGGSLTISIVQSYAPPQAGGGPARSSKARILADLQQKSKLRSAKPSDEVEALNFRVHWEPTKGALSVVISPEDGVVLDNELSVDADDLDFESLLRKVIKKHTKAILTVFQRQLQHGPTRTVFSPAGAISLVADDNTYALRADLCGDEVVIVTVDPRTGRLNLRDTGDLAAAGRGPRFTAISERLNENPSVLLEALVRLRLHTITDLAEQKANYLGLRSFRNRNFPKEEVQKLGPATRGMLYIQLSSFPSHYLVLVITDDEFRYALISVDVLSDSMYANMIMQDIGWLDVRRIHGEGIIVMPRPELPATSTGVGQSHDHTESERGPGLDDSMRFNLDTQILRELYAYCCARVAYTKVEKQLKLRGIPYTHVNPHSGLLVTPELAHIQSSLARSVPSLCVQSSDILSGAPAAEAAMPNIRVIPLNWWSEKKAQVVTCVKLKYVQQPMGKTAGTSSIIRPSKRIIYDTTEAVVFFLSEEVDTCVDEFLEEWARVSKMVVIAREVGKMAKGELWSDVRLLSFDLQTVEFAYAQDYVVSITCTDQLSPSGGSFDLRFSRHTRVTATSSSTFNPHDDAEPFLRNILRHGHGRLAPSVHSLVALLRDTLPIVAELEEIRFAAEKGGDAIDTFAKAAGWYRLLYGDLRHALDFRLLSGQRVAILDGSRSLFRDDIPSVSSTTTTAAVFSTSKPSSPAKTPVLKSSPSKSITNSSKSNGAEEDTSSLGLQAIPQFQDIVLDAVQDITTSHPETSNLNIAPVDVGVVCNAGAVRFVARAIHERVLQVLRG